MKLCFDDVSTQMTSYDAEIELCVVLCHVLSQLISQITNFTTDDIEPVDEYTEDVNYTSIIQ